MKSLNERLQIVEEHVKNDEITIMIIGLGSVGTFLLDFLVSKNDPAMKFVVVGRNEEKIQSDVNIVRVAGLIRELNKSEIIVEAGVDLNDILSIEKAISKYNPDFIVNIGVSGGLAPNAKRGTVAIGKSYVQTDFHPYIDDNYPKIKDTEDWIIDGLEKSAKDNNFDKWFA